LLGSSGGRRLGARDRDEIHRALLDQATELLRAASF